MAKHRVLTGVQATGYPHLGNYLGAIRPAIELANQSENESLLFIADYHSLTAMQSPEQIKEGTLAVAASWLASGLDPKKTIIYRQSDVPEIFELAWVLSCFSPKGLMNRAHAYKAKVALNQEAGKSDLDDGVNMGLFNYPILMAADILTFGASMVPIGEDQVQHLEIARDLVQKFNNTYGEVLVLPKFKVSSKIIVGLDGRKMSKSYGNTIPLFDEAKSLRKKVMKIKTDSSPPEAPKDPDDSLVFDLYKEVASPEQIQALADRYRVGIGWGEAKQELFEVLDAHLSEKRKVFNEYMTSPEKLESILKDGAKRARKLAQPILRSVREAIGVGPYLASDS
ncbi:MAG: tryptophan--tRNA ligase [Pseudobdellovibrionaceae bacterium]|nr:tryptophan--tRNA ligase [Bdellovibrionales bacterium]USN47971.1 MAG: tryptophan--tRNA ligase [Pseudobdellovibrionaceae bacterium]